MKKILTGLLMTLAGAFCLQAQTDFRHITFAEAQQAAKAENKMIFVDFYTEWCGPCKRMAKLVFPTQKVGDFLNANFVNLKIDAEKGEGVELAKKYGVKAYPTLCVIDADGNLTGSFAGLKEGDDFIAAVQLISDPDMKPEIVKAKYAAGDRSPKVVLGYANVIVDESRDYVAAYQQAQEVVNDYFNGLTDDQRLLPENSFIFTRYAGDYESPQFKFMQSNIDKMDPALKDQLKEVEKNAYLYYGSRLFTENRLTDKAAKDTYFKFKKEAGEKGYLAELGNKPLFIEKRADMDDAKFLEFCDKNFETLSDDEMTQFAYAISKNFATDTKEQKKAIADMLRRHIAAAPTGAIYYMAMSVMNLESENSH